MIVTSNGTNGSCAAAMIMQKHPKGHIASRLGSHLRIFMAGKHSGIHQYSETGGLYEDDGERNRER